MKVATIEIHLKVKGVEEQASIKELRGFLKEEDVPWDDETNEPAEENIEHARRVNKALLQNPYAYADIEILIDQIVDTLCNKNMSGYEFDDVLKEIDEICDNEGVFKTEHKLRIFSEWCKEAPDCNIPLSAIFIREEL